MKLLHLRNDWLMDGWALLQGPPGVHLYLAVCWGWHGRLNRTGHAHLISLPVSAPVLGRLGGSIR